ncbi:MAG TPA: hypothetical protein VFQ53_13240 [Kofleriaceae bacterium]|nr:hypothetical protein [Kofleriaceae bacterium]
MAKPKKLVRSGGKPSSAKRVASKPMTKARPAAAVEPFVLPPLAAIRPAPPTGDRALDERLHAVTTGTDQALTAIDLLASDRRPEVVHALRERVSALAEAIDPVPELPKRRTRKLENLVSDRIGELEARIWRLSWTLEALTAHGDAGAEGQILAIWRAHPNLAARAAAGKALLGYRFSKQTDARPYDGQRRASRAALDQMLATLDDPTPGSEAGELRNLAAEAMYLVDPVTAYDRFAPYLQLDRAIAEQRAVDAAPDEDHEDHTPPQPVYSVGKALWTHLVRPIAPEWRARFQPLRETSFWFAQLLA